MTRSLDKTDVLVLALAAICAVAAIAMLVDYWPVLLFSFPLLAIVLMTLGAMRRNQTWGRRSAIAIGIFSTGLLALMVWAFSGVTSDRVVWGLQEGLAVYVYFVWPYTAIFSGLLYAFVYSDSLRGEVDTMQLPNHIRRLPRSA